jgi:hypothetical protein
VVIRSSGWSESSSVRPSTGHRAVDAPFLGAQVVSAVDGYARWLNRIETTAGNRNGPCLFPAGPGLTFAKLAECQYVIEVLGALPLSVAYERLAGMVRMLGEDVQAMALRNAYAIDMPPAVHPHSAP